MAVDSAKLRANLQSARRAASAGPSGATAEHLQVLLDDEDCCDLLVAAAHRLAQADVPEAITAGVRLGRMVALLKPGGGIRALGFGVLGLFRVCLGFRVWGFGGERERVRNPKP